MNIVTLYMCTLALFTVEPQEQKEPSPEAKQEAAQAPRGARVRIRFIDNSIKDGFVLKADDKGILFQAAEKESPVVRFLWEEIHTDDVIALKTLLLGSDKPDTPAPEASIIGIQLILKNKQSVRGVLDPTTSDVKSYRIKTLKGYRVVRRDDVELEEKIDLRLNEVFTPEEIYSMVLERVKPATPDGYEKFAAELVKVGLPDRAFEAFRISIILRRPELPEGKLYKDMLKLMGLLETATLKETVYQAQGHYVRRELDNVIALMDHLIQDLAGHGKGKDILEEVQRIRTEVQVMRELSRDEQIVSEWYRTVESLLLSKAMDRNLGYHDAVRYVSGQMATDVQKMVAARFHIGADDPSVRTIWERRPKNVHLKTAYDESSWIVYRPESADRERWWSQADSALRYKYLKGVYVEKQMYVTQAFDKNCSLCGGTGRVETTSPEAPSMGECPSCLGLKKHRVVLYR